METEEKDGLHTVATESLAQAPSSGATISAVLNAAADLIEPEGAWTRGWWARDSRNLTTSPMAPNAVCWCLRGAIAKLTGSYAKESVEDFVALALGNDPETFSLGGWNDSLSTTQAEVVAVLRKAAELAATQP